MAKNTNSTLILSSIFALTSLILFYPAFSAPLLRISLHHLDNHSTAMQALFNLFIEQHPFLGFVVGLTVFVLPIFYLLIVAYIPLIKTNNYFNRSLLKMLTHISDWHMVDIFLMGILVSLVKLVKDFQVDIGNGLFFIIALTISIALTSHFFDMNKAWGKLQ